jgi:predicted DNA-binding transcriptional regulator AlpA
MKPYRNVTPVPPDPGTFVAPLYLTQGEVAAHLRLSERTLERLRACGTGPRFVKLGRRVVYRQEDVETWAAAHTVTSTSEAEVLLCR